MEPEKKIIENQLITTSKIFVGGIPFYVGEDEFYAYFLKFGPIQSLVFPKPFPVNLPNRDTPLNKGYGFIVFKSLDSVRNVLFYDKNHYLRAKVVF